MKANINQFKLAELYNLESNSARANQFVNAFVNGINRKDQVQEIDNMAKITKKDIIDFANKHFSNNYAVIYKREGTDPNEIKISKPEITPIFMNRDAVSCFLKGIQASEVIPIEPVFIDFDKDMEQFSFQSKVPVLYKQNTTNDLFELYYVFDMGNNNDKALGEAFSYMEYLGTFKFTPEQLKSRFYQLGCSFNVYPSNDRTYVTLSGLNKNMEKAIALFEHLLADAQVNKKAYANLANDIIKSRADGKLNQDANFDYLMQYAFYGPQSPATNILSNKETKKLNPQELVDRIHNLNSYKHRIMYYGPNSKEQLTKVLDKYHQTPEKLKDVPTEIKFERLTTPTNKVLLAHYDAKQTQIAFLSNRGEKYNPAISPACALYNSYFGSGMNSIVFQEMRESRGLAYSTFAGVITPNKLKDPYTMYAYIASQNDKATDTLSVFNDIINNMPESEAAFELAKESIINQLRTSRITKADILWNYIAAQDLGTNIDSRKYNYEQIQRLTLKNVIDFQKEWVKGRTYTYCILGDEKDIDMDNISKYGPIQRVSQEEIFGH